jgi:DNA repair protein RecO (recombination protein O)
VLYKTQGIIIKTSNSGEVDRLITIYTKEFGKLLLKAKSVRKNQAKLKGHLELFLYSHLIVAPGRGLDIITGAETIEGFSRLRKNLPSLAAAYYLSELVDKLVAGPERDENIWQLLLGSFKVINREDSEIRTTVENFERSILRFLGYGKQDNFLKFVESLSGEKMKSYQLLIKIL